MRVDAAMQPKAPTDAVHQSESPMQCDAVWRDCIGVTSRNLRFLPDRCSDAVKNAKCIAASPPKSSMISKDGSDAVDALPIGRERATASLSLPPRETGFRSAFIESFSTRFEALQ
jgi:hypothetical protein